MKHIDADWIRERLDRGQGDRAGLAKALGVRPEIISRMLHGKRRIRADEVPVILHYFSEGVPDPWVAALEKAALSPAMQRLTDQLAGLSDEELDFLTAAARGLHAQKSE